MFRPIAEVDAEVVTIRFQEPSNITFASYDKIICLDLENLEYKISYTTPDNGIIHGFDIYDDMMVIHYHIGDNHILTTSSGKIIDTINDPDHRMLSSFDTVKMVKHQCYWGIGNNINDDDMDPKDLSSSLDSLYGKLYRYDISISPPSRSLIAYGIRQVNGMAYNNRKLYLAHNGYNWRSVYMLDIDKENQYLGWRYYDGPLPTMRKVDNGWTIMYPITNTTLSPIKPKIFYSPTISSSNRYIGTGYIKGVIYHKYTGSVRYLDSNIGLFDPYQMSGYDNHHNDGQYTAITTDGIKIYVSKCVKDGQCIIQEFCRHNTNMPNPNRNDSSTEEIRKLGKIFERSKHTIGGGKIINDNHRYHHHHNNQGHQDHHGHHKHHHRHHHRRHRKD